MGNPQSSDFDDFKQKVLKELYAGKPLMSGSGIFTPLLKHFGSTTIYTEKRKPSVSPKASVNYKIGIPYKS